MNAVITWLKTILESMWTLVKIASWTIDGIKNFGAVALASANILGKVMEFLPTAVCGTIMASCAILVTLRILGR